MADILNILLFLQNQTRFYHWSTKSHSRHVAAGDLYDNVSANTDTFVEVYQGIYGRIKLTSTTKNFKYDNIDDVKIVQFLKKCKIEFIKAIDKNKIKETDLLNIRDEILANINKTLFLFTLK
jgi:hypothetical protein